MCLPGGNIVGVGAEAEHNTRILRLGSKKEIRERKHCKT